MYSPLRYPGGKSDFFAVAKRIFEDGGFSGMPVVEPYAGSAAVSLGLLDFGLTSHVTILERDPLLYSFWHCVFNRTHELIVKFQELSITIETWNRFRPFLLLDVPNESNILELGLAGLFFNRTNFSGILNAGPIGGKGQASKYKIDCRTNKNDIICRILAIAMFAGKVTVEFGDAVEKIVKMSPTKNAFFYLDPPYFNKGELLYRHFYRLKQHKQLAVALAHAEFSWLLSYDDHHVIEFLYSDFSVTKLNFRYSAHSPKNHDELLISNFPVKLTHIESVSMDRRQHHRTADPFSNAEAPAVA